ncbi:MAG TPA: SpoIVB peptidase [Bacillales bacterium]|nr:SpoIVB peptidase [Bacillales bacterium]
MKSEHIRRWIGFVLLAVLLGILFVKPVQQYFSLPNHVAVLKNETLQWLDSESLLSSSTHVSGESSIATVSDGKVKGENIGTTSLALSVGDFPIKKTNVHVLPDLKVIPGGQSIGVKLNTVGVLVVGYHLVTTKSGEHSPAENAGIKIGDMITKINGHPIHELEDVAPFVKEAGKNDESLTLTLLRGDKKINKKVTPLKDRHDDAYQIGLYIRDSAAGIGTLTFYDPKTMVYGALGHVISDIDTKKPVIVNKGKIVGSTVTSIDKGSHGKPGEKIAHLTRSEEILGSVRENSPFGIFGKLKHDPNVALTHKPIPIGLSREVKEGPAKIYTVVDGNEVEAFDIKIVNSVPQKFPSTKGLVIKVTDPELLKKTGGIVQGMSGSPIIQNGKLIGAVTHVFVNDPTSGYGVHIEWMLDEAGYTTARRKAS